MLCLGELKRRKCCLPAFFPFPRMFSRPFESWMCCKSIHAIIFSDKYRTMDLIFQDLRWFSRTDSPPYFFLSPPFFFNCRLVVNPLWQDPIVQNCKNYLINQQTTSHLCAFDISIFHVWLLLLTTERPGQKSHKNQLTLWSTHMTQKWRKHWPFPNVFSVYNISSICISLQKCLNTFDSYAVEFQLNQTWKYFVLPIVMYII